MSSSKSFNKVVVGNKQSIAELSTWSGTNTSMQILLYYQFHWFLETFKYIQKMCSYVMTGVRRDCRLESLECCQINILLQSVCRWKLSLLLTCSVCIIHGIRRIMRIIFNYDGESCANTSLLWVQRLFWRCSVENVMINVIYRRGILFVYRNS